MLMLDILSGYWLSEYKQTPRYTLLVRVNHHFFHFTYTNIMFHILLDEQLMFILGFQ